jgi:uncharacterized protein YbjT (DUF2867 family)
MAGIANQATQGNEVHLSNIKFQPIAAEDVASFVTQTAISTPLNGIREIAGPQRFTMYEIIAKYLKEMNDPRKVIADGKPQYYGGEVNEYALVPEGYAEKGSTTFEVWFKTQLQKA